LVSQRALLIRLSISCAIGAELRQGIKCFRHIKAYPIGKATFKAILPVARHLEQAVASLLNGMIEQSEA
jgi:hypothetical protein